MSERGIEIHNGKVVIPGSQMKQIQLGTWASPITQTLAAQVIVSAVVNAIALGGDVHGGYFGVKASVSMTGDIRGLRARATVNDGITLTGSVFGAYIEAEVLGEGVVSPFFEGIRIDMSVDADASVNLVYGIFIVSSINSQPGTYSFIRMSENGACTINHVFHVYKGASCIDIEYLFQLDGTPPSAWISSGAPLTGEAGHLKIRIGSTVRYIQLYSTLP